MKNMIDPFYKKKIIDLLYQQIEDYQISSQDELNAQAETLNRLLFKPLNDWLNTQDKENEAVKAGVELSLAIQEIIIGFQYYGFQNNDIESLSDAWDSFQMQMGWDSSLDAADFEKKIIEYEPFVRRDQARQAGCSSAGKISGEQKASELIDRNQKIGEKAKKLIENGRRRDCVSILAEQFELSTRQVRNILKFYHISTLKKKRK
jgi:hypothetical protein